jgi:hypothetical protein
MIDRQATGAGAPPDRQQPGAATTPMWSSWTMRWVPAATPGIPPSTSARAWCHRRSGFISTRTATGPPGMCASTGSTFGRGCTGTSTRSPIEVPASTALHEVKLLLRVSGCVAAARAKNSTWIVSTAVRTRSTSTKPGMDSVLRATAAAISENQLVAFDQVVLVGLGVAQGDVEAVQQRSEACAAPRTRRTTPRRAPSRRGDQAMSRATARPARSARRRSASLGLSPLGLTGQR